MDAHGKLLIRFIIIPEFSPCRQVTEIAGLFLHQQWQIQSYQGCNPAGFSILPGRQQLSPLTPVPTHAMEVICCISFSLPALLMHQNVVSICYRLMKVTYL